MKQLKHWWAPVNFTSFWFQTVNVALVIVGAPSCFRFWTAGDQGQITRNV